MDEIIERIKIKEKLPLEFERMISRMKSNEIQKNENELSNIFPNLLDENIVKRIKRTINEETPLEFERIISRMKSNEIGVKVKSKQD
jgi:hypothetical protein